MVICGVRDRYVEMVGSDQRDTGEKEGGQKHREVGWVSCG